MGSELLELALLQDDIDTADEDETADAVSIASGTWCLADSVSTAQTSLTASDMSVSAGAAPAATERPAERLAERPAERPAAAKEPQRKATGKHVSSILRSLTFGSFSSAGSSKASPGRDASKQRRRGPASRSECNRVRLEWLEQLQPIRGNEWLRSMDSCADEYARFLDAHPGLAERDPDSCLQLVPGLDDGLVLVNAYGSDCDVAGCSGSAAGSVAGTGSPRSASSRALYVEENKASSDEEAAAAAAEAAAAESDSRREGEIERDVVRTYPTLARFQGAGTQQQLQRLLQWVATTYKSVGYVQGMNYICAQLLLHCPGEQRAAEVLRRLMEEPCFNLHGLFAKGLQMPLRLLALLRGMLREVDPELAQRLDAIGAGDLHFCLNWLLTLLAYSMPFETLCDVWDLFLRQGWLALLKVYLALVCSVRDDLLAGALDLEAALGVLKAAPVFPPPDLLARAKFLKLRPEWDLAVPVATRSDLFQ